MSTLRDEQRIYAAHVWAMFQAGRTGPAHAADQNVPGSLEGWGEADRALLIEEGRRQLDRHVADVDRVRTRGQVVFAVGIVLVGSTATLIDGVDTVGNLFLWVLWGTALTIGAWATLGSAAVATVAARTETIHATVLSNRSPPVELELAKDYAAIVVSGENAVAVRLTNFRWAVSYLLVAAALAAAALAWTRLHDSDSPQSERWNSTISTTVSPIRVPPNGP